MAVEGLLSPLFSHWVYRSEKKHKVPFLVYILGEGDGQSTIQ